MFKFTQSFSAVLFLVLGIFSSSAAGHDVAVSSASVFLPPPLIKANGSSQFSCPSYSFQFFSSNSIMEVEWVAEDVSTLSLHEINEFENAIAVLLYTTMKKESESNVGLLPEQKVLAIDLHVKNVTKKSSSFHLNAVVDVLYVAQAGIPDMASVLIRLSRQENVEDSLLDDIYEILGGTAESVNVHFKTLEPPATKLWELQDHDHASQKADTSLILACTLLCAALVLVTSVLLYVAGGWRDLREKLEEQIDWIKDQRRTYSSDESDEESGEIDVADSGSADEGDEEATNSSGIIGASSNDNNAMEGLGINSTPERGITDDGYDTTPFSEMSNYTDTSRAPLGITSMRKMLPSNGHRDRDSMLSSLPPLAYQ